MAPIGCSLPTSAGNRHPWLRTGFAGSAQPFLDVTSRLVPLNPGYDERGLLGLAFDPGFANPSSPGYRTLYTYTSEPVKGPADFTVPMPTDTPFDHQNVVAEWKVSASNPNLVDTCHSP